MMFLHEKGESAPGKEIITQEFKSITLYIIYYIVDIIL